jgi:hypothetical protein
LSVLQSVCYSELLRSAGVPSATIGAADRSYAKPGLLLSIVGVVPVALAKATGASAFVASTVPSGKSRRRLMFQMTSPLTTEPENRTNEDASLFNWVRRQLLMILSTARCERSPLLKTVRFSGSGGVHGRNLKWLRIF